MGTILDTKPYREAAPAAQRWKCTVCGQIFEGDAPPAPCPVCGAGADAFVAEKEAPGGVLGGSDSRFVIVGGGGAGLAAAKAIREVDRTAKVTLVCGEVFAAIPFYSIVPFTDYPLQVYSHILAYRPVSYTHLHVGKGRSNPVPEV